MTEANPAIFTTTIQMDLLTRELLDLVRAQRAMQSGKRPTVKSILTEAISSYLRQQVVVR